MKLTSYELMEFIEVASHKEQEMKITKVLISQLEARVIGLERLVNDLKIRLTDIDHK